MPRTCSEEERAEVIDKAKQRIAEWLTKSNHCFTAKSIAQTIDSPVAPWLVENIVHDLYGNHDPCFAGAARYYDRQIYYFRAPDYVVQESKEL